MLLNHLEQLRTMPHDLTEPIDKARAIIFLSGLSRRDVSELSGMSIPRVHSIYRGGEAELQRATTITINALAQGYDALLIELKKFK